MVFNLKKIIFLFLTLMVVESAKVYFNQTYSIILFSDWDPRNDVSPPYSEKIQITEEENGERLQYTYNAFGRDWKLQVQTNTVIMGSESAMDITNNQGVIKNSIDLRKYKGCFYIGTAESQENEVGFAAVTRCMGKFRAYVITNKNDYMINVLVPKKKKSLFSNFRGRPNNKFGPEDMLKQFDQLRNKTSISRKRRDLVGNLTEFIEIKPMARPLGRMVYVEAAFIYDQPYKDSFLSTMMNDVEEYYLHTIELLNFGQVWYLHPTFGYRVWFSAKRIIHLNDTFRSVKSGSAFDSNCQWFKDTFTDSSTWDEVFLMTGDRTKCNNLGGVAMPSGVCSSEIKERCACVYTQDFHLSSLIRTLVHEAAHPLGMPDDYRPPTSEICFTGIMRYGVFTDNDWSTCSIQTFERFLHVKENTCVHQNNSPSITSDPPIIPVDVAWRGIAKQSSTYLNDKTWGAWKAVDGPVAGTPWENNLQGNLYEFGSCTQTVKEKRPWLKIDLGEKYKNNWIDAIHIYNREDCCGHRLKNFEVRVGNSEDFSRNVLCFYHKKAVEGGKYGMTKITCSEKVRGRYVSIQMIENEETILSVCQVFVFQNIQMENFDHTSLSCFDEGRWCDDWLRLGDCGVIEGRNLCQRSCRVCHNDANPPQLNLTAKSDAQVDSPQPSHCRDSHPSCWHKAAMGWCAQEDDYCVASCKPECNGGIQIATTTAASVINPTEESEIVHTPPTNPNALPDVNCKDDRETCHAWASNGYCQSAPQIKDFCRKSCGVCKLPDSVRGATGVRTKNGPLAASMCRDEDPNCRSWTSYCGEAHILQKCRRSCQVCQ